MSHSWGAVQQAQKWIERNREQRNRRIAVFRSLMTTRASVLAPEHVASLNVVPIEFFDKQSSFVDVIDAWKVYIDYLYTDVKDQQAWLNKRVELLNDMLGKMAKALGYRFNSVELSRELYSPRGHAAIQSDQDIIRQGFAKIFKGEISLPMDVKTFPADPKFIEGQRELQAQLLSWLKGEIIVKVATETPLDNRKT